jgi:hypothetical protein
MVAAGVATPVTTPLALTVALAVLLLLHVPPGVALASVMLLPAATAAGPVIGATEGAASTVTVLRATHPE